MPMRTFLDSVARLSEQTKRLRPLTILAMGGALLLAAYFLWPWRSEDSGPSKQAIVTPVPEVGIVTMRAAEIPYPVEYAGRVVGFRDVEVRQRVSGLLLKREYEEGTKVTQGQLLFQIDPATYQVALNRAEAQLQQAQATLRQAGDRFGPVAPSARRWPPMHEYGKCFEVWQHMLPFASAVRIAGQDRSGRKCPATAARQSFFLPRDRPVPPIADLPPAHRHSGDGRA